MEIYKDDRIKTLLPHRGSMLLVNEIILNDDGKVTGIYKFSGSEWFFDGHYPNEPLVPGVILCEIMAQVSCGLFKNSTQEKTQSNPYITGITKAVFRKKVKPNDKIIIETCFKQRKGPFWFVSAQTFIDKDPRELCAEGEFTFYCGNSK